MEITFFFAVQCIGFGLINTVSGFPIDFSSVGTGGPNPLWLTGYFFTVVGFLLTITVVAFGCVCCRNTKGFQEFTNASNSQSTPSLEGFVNPTSNSELTIFPPAGISPRQICRFEPLPDIKPQAPNLRPAAFSYSEREISSQDWFAKPCQNFPRNQLKYVQEYGRGWFGRVVEGEAQNITPKEKLTKVMVKILHEDATPTDQMYFLHEVKFYRDLKHPNILCLLGQCLETEPFLIILECYPNGDLKTFLSQNLASATALVEQGVTLRMCANITSGLQFMHENKFIHIDLAARNCLVGPDLTVKIGDYGNSIEIFKSDYYCAGSVALPVRWCAPETLKCTDVTIETREVTPLANIWSLAVVFWEICEFCKLPYAELNDDQVIVQVLGEKNYFLEKPNMFCLHKDEMYHLMKLCWNPPVQRPSAAQILVVLENLMSCKVEEVVQEDSKHMSQDFEQRWQNLKPNYIPKRDNAVEVDYSANCSIISSKLLNAKVVDSSLVDSPLGIFMSSRGSGQVSPRFCLKAEKKKSSEDVEDKNEPLENLDEIIEQTFAENSDQSKNDAMVEICDKDKIPQEPDKDKQNIDFEYNVEIKPPEILSSLQKLKEHESDVDSWLKGVKINDEEDETFVRKISEAIRDLDATLAMEKTSSSEENSGKSSHQNSPGKNLKETSEHTVDFKLGSDTSSFINFTQKSFELSSLQNTEQPQSLNFTDAFLTDKKSEFDDDNYGPNSLIMPIIKESRENNDVKNDVLDESLKESDSYLGGQSRNSSDTDDEVWRRRIERGEISEKVKEKSKSIANLMILTHIDASDDSDIDLDKPFDRNIFRNSLLKRSGSFAKSSLSSNNFGSENDITNAILEDDFKESLKKLSNNHKEHGHFDSLGMILPSSANRENVWESLFRNSEPNNDLDNVNKPTTSQTDLSNTKEDLQSNNNNSQTPVNEEKKLNPDDSNNFLGNAASEKFNDNKLNQTKNQGDALNILCKNKIEESDHENSLKKDESNCDNCKCNADYFTNNNSSEINSSQLKEINAKETIEQTIDQANNAYNDCFHAMANENYDQPNSDSLENLHSSDLNEDLKLSETCNSKTEDTKRNDHESGFSPFADGNDLVLSVSLDHSAENSSTINPLESTESDVKISASDKMTRDPSGIPKIMVTEADEKEVVNNFEDVFEPVVTKCRPFKFILKNNEELPEKTNEKEREEISDQEQKSDLENQITEKDNISTKPESLNNVARTESFLDNSVLNKEQSNVVIFPNNFLGNKTDFRNFNNDDEVSVIIGACEDYTLDYYKGLKTTSGDISMEKPAEETINNLSEQMIADLRNTEVNVEDWNKHLEKPYSLEFKDTDFDISFKNFGEDSEELKDSKDVLIFPGKDMDSFLACPVETIVNFIESEKIHTEKVEEPVHINRITNLNGMSSEEEYDNFKLRTPDDERSSDSGFRDKGSLSESVEDACEGKYNLEDIEAELEEAYVKGAFGNCEVEKEKPVIKDSSNSNNFEYEESKFYEDENKNEEDFSDIDGEIEFWNNKENREYYFEISEFNPNCSQGWYLHPPDENVVTYDRNVSEDIVNALRNELRENLPVQMRSFDEFNDDFYESEFGDSKKDFNIQYVSDVGIPLSPIIEEQDCVLDETENSNVKNSVVDGTNSNKVRKNIVNLMDSVRSIDTKTFMQYLDYMIENEGKDMDDIKDCENENEEALMSSPLIVKPQDENKLENTNFEEDIKNALGINSVSRSESTVSESEQSGYALLLEDLESGRTSKVTKETNTEDDVLIVNVDTNEMALLESPKPKSYLAFLDDNQRDDFLDVAAENSENEGLIFSPELLSPERERSLSEISRSSNGTRTGDALSDITLSSPDLVPDCFSTSVQEIVQNNEANEIIDDLKSSGIINENHSNKPVVAFSPEKKESNTCSLPLIQVQSLVQNSSVFLEEEKPDSEVSETKSVQEEGVNMELEKYNANKNENRLVEEILDFNKKSGNDSYEMSTSFMEEDDDYCEDEKHLNSDKLAQKDESLKPKYEKDLSCEDSYTADWESDSSEGEEMSSSSGEFIWKDGDKESKVKAVRASGCDNENSLYEKSVSDNSTVEITDVTNQPEECLTEKKRSDEEDEGEEDDESSTGSSASINDFIPSAWNSQATPSRPALKSPDKKVDGNQKKSVWFKKQKYHCVYEYPREPSDNEDVDNSFFDQLTSENNTSDAPNRHFTFGLNAGDLANKHFPYDISNVIDYSSYTDWNILEGEDGDLSLTDTDSETGIGKTDMSKEVDLNFYNMNPFDYDFNNSGILNDESEFYVSSSSRPFQGSSSSQFFPGNNQVTVFNEINNSKNLKSNSDDVSESSMSNSKDFITPDSGVEDSINVTPLYNQINSKNQKEPLEKESSNNSNGILNILDNFNFNSELILSNLEKNNFKTNRENASPSPTDLSTLSDNTLSTLSPSGLGELRHARDKLKLDLTHNHNADISTVTNKISKKNTLNL